MRYLKTIKFIYIASSVLLSLLLFTSGVQAKVKVGPMVIMTETKQGQAKGVITLTNQGTQRVRFRLYSQAFIYNQKGLKVSKSQQNDLSPYLIFSPRVVVIPPGQRRRVRILARILPSMAKREYRSVIFAEPVKKQKESGLSLTSRVGVTIYVRHGKLSFDLSPKMAVYDRATRQINLLIQNKGEATVRPGLRWQLTKAGRQIKKGQFSAITILADGVRKIPIRFFQKGDKPIYGRVRLKGELLWETGNDTESLPFDFKVYIPRYRR